MIIILNFIGKTIYWFDKNHYLVYYCRRATIIIATSWIPKHKDVSTVNNFAFDDRSSAWLFMQTAKRGGPKINLLGIQALTPAHDEVCPFRKLDKT